MRVLSAKVLNAIEQRIKLIEAVTGSLNWKYSESNGDELISVVADNLTEQQDLALSEIDVWSEMLITNEVTLSPWADSDLVSLGISIDSDELEKDDVEDITTTIKNKFPVTPIN